MDERDETANEWRNFGILAVILIGTAIVIALLRPLIFNNIVPAVMNDPNGGTSIELPVLEPTAMPVEIVPVPTAEVAPTPTLAPVDVEDGSNSMTDPAPTAEPDVDTIDHIVKSGQTLFQISQMYGVTVQDILDVNEIKNPNAIQAGFKIKIPVKLEVEK